MILAAGRGTRLGALGRSIPKALVPLAGRPLLAHQLEFLAAQGVRRVIVNAHHLADQMLAFAAAGPHPVALEVAVELELRGTAGGVRAVLERFDPAHPIVVLCADTLLEAPVTALVGAHRDSGAEGTICATWLPDTRAKGLITATPDGAITAFAEKPPAGPPGLASAGLYILERRLVELVSPDGAHDFALDLFPAALAAGRHLRVARLDGIAHDIGTPEALELAAHRAARGELALRPGSSAAAA